MLRIAYAITIFVSLTASLLWRRKKAFIALKQYSQVLKCGE